MSRWTSPAACAAASAASTWSMTASASPVESRPRSRTHLAQVRAGHELHDEERPAAVGALVVDRDDVGVRQPGGGACLALEPGERLAVVGQVGVQHLDGDPTLQPGVGGEVDRRHAAVGDERLDGVSAFEQPTDQRVAQRRVHQHESRCDAMRLDTAGATPSRWRRTASSRRTSRGRAPTAGPGSTPRRPAASTCLVGQHRQQRDPSGDVVLGVEQVELAVHDVVGQVAAGVGHDLHRADRADRRDLAHVEAGLLPRDREGERSGRGPSGRRSRGSSRRPRRRRLAAMGEQVRSRVGRAGRRRVLVAAAAVGRDPVRDGEPLAEHDDQRLRQVVAPRDHRSA